MNGFDTAALLIAIAAVAGYANRRVLRLPYTSGTLAVALVSSLVLVGADVVFPRWRLRATIAGFLADIDFNATLMRGMLCFLLFAGALRVDLQGLRRDKWTIGSLATIGVLISTVITGLLSWWAFGLLGLEVPLGVCLVFGALISPTDPVAVMGLLKELGGLGSLDAQIGGESLFNDGVGVVVFLALVSLADPTGTPGARPPTADWVGVIVYFVREVIGGTALGLLFGYAGYRALRTVDDHALELLMTLALAMSLYALSFQIHVSGPLAVVVAGIVIGNPGRRLGMSQNTRDHVDAFWGMLDEILNAVLFLLIGLQVFSVSGRVSVVLAGVIAIPIVLIARFVSVGVPVAVMRLVGRPGRGLLMLLTWSGLRGGLSVAMVLSLPPFPARDLLLTSTYAVVVFSILVQGLTVRRMLERYRLGA